jgi:uncharacterized membrane protein YadS
MFQRKVLPPSFTVLIAVACFSAVCVLATKLQRIKSQKTVVLIITAMRTLSLRREAEVLSKTTSCSEFLRVLRYCFVAYSWPFYDHSIMLPAGCATTHGSGEGPD